MEETQNGLFPDYEPILQEFENMIVWKKLNNNHKVPEPAKGIDKNFDNCNLKIEKIKQRMEDYIQDIVKGLGC